MNGNGAQDGGDTAVNSANLIQEEGDYVLVITCTDKGDYVTTSPSRFPSPSLPTRPKAPSRSAW